MEGNYSGARERPREGRGEMLPAGGRRVAPDGSGNIRGRQLGRDRRPTRPPFVAARPICHSRFFRLAVSSIGWPGRSRAGARV